MIKTAIILDASNLMRRALHTPFAWNNIKADPNSNAGVYMFLNIFHPLYKTHSDSDFYFVLDGSPKQKKEEYVQYKANRVKLDNIYYNQIDKMKSIMNNFPIKTVLCKEREADDIVYYLCQKLSKEYAQIIVISNDKDFIQLLQQFDNIKVYNPIQKEFRELPNGLTGKFTDFKALFGDEGDNVPKIISETKALKSANDIDAWKATATEDQLKQYEQNLRLVDFTLLTFNNLEIEQTEYSYNKIKVKELLEEYKFKSILKKFNEWSNIFENSIFNSLF